MNVKFGQALVVGKFAPLHRGHQWLIDRARAQSERVLLLSYSNPEFAGMGPALRRQWLATVFGDLRSVVLDHEQVRRWGLALPHNGADGAVHRQFVARVCYEVLGVVVDAVFTSEDYGGPFAEALSVYYSERLGRPHCVTHVAFDPARPAIPTSGTAIRREPYAHRSELEPAVYASLIARIALLGPESSGKTTLALALAQALNTRYAAEYGRELWVLREGRLDEGDLLTIAREQIRREERLLCDCRDVLVCDTSPLTTALYSQLLFGRVAPDLEELAARQYGLTVYCAADFDFVQDGTRVGEEFQRRQDALGRAELQRRNLDVLQVHGSVEQRVAQVLQAVQTRRLARPFAQ